MLKLKDEMLDAIASRAKIVAAASFVKDDDM